MESPPPSPQSPARSCSVHYCSSFFAVCVDGIVRYEGTEILLAKATTPSDIAQGKELKQVPGKKHDLLANASQEVRSSYVQWADVRLSAMSTPSL